MASGRFPPCESRLCCGWHTAASAPELSNVIFLLELLRFTWGGIRRPGINGSRASQVETLLGDPRLFFPPHCYSLSLVLSYAFFRLWYLRIYTNEPGIKKNRIVFIKTLSFWGIIHRLRNVQRRQTIPSRFHCVQEENTQDFILFLGNATTFLHIELPTSSVYRYHIIPKMFAAYRSTWKL